jgi:hypothetical protein
MKNHFAKLFNLEEQGVQVLVTIDYDEEEEVPHKVTITSKIEGITANAICGYTENNGDKAQAYFGRFNEKQALGFYNDWVKRIIEA